MNNTKLLILINYITFIHWWKNITTDFRTKNHVHVLKVTSETPWENPKYDLIHIFLIFLVAHIYSSYNLARVVILLSALASEVLTGRNAELTAAILIILESCALTASVRVSTITFNSTIDDSNCSTKTLAYDRVNIGHPIP